MASPLLEVVNLQTYFTTHESIRKAVDGVSLTVNEGEVLGVVGRSGSGKSVLARSIMGLINPPGRIVGGDICFRGRSLLKLPEEELNRIRGAQISLIVGPARSRLNPLVTIGNQLANVIRAKQDLSKEKAYAQGQQLLEAVGIADPARIARSLPTELSGGMCQRVIITMALANSPSLILADEPITGLDVTVQLQVLDLMMDLVRLQGAALLLMTRDLGVVAHYSQRIAVLKDGQIVEENDTRAFFAHPEHPHSIHLLTAAFAARGRDVAVTREPVAD
jgi:ABC-type dipeptide/oligopeptide/nickel transport system ATPase component